MPQQRRQSLLCCHLSTIEPFWAQQLLKRQPKFRGFASFISYLLHMCTKFRPVS